MNRTEQLLLQTIQSSLWHRSAAFPADADWDAVLREAKEQTVLGIVFPMAPAQAQAAWRGRDAAQLSHVVRLLHQQEQLCSLLESNRIPLVILKGTAAAVYYPDPFRRTMGDIDFLVPPSHVDAARALLTCNGYDVREEERYPRHIHIYKDGIRFELHRFFSGEDTVVERYIREGFDHIERRRVGEAEFPMLPRVANGLVLLEHMGRHLKTGLGLRQLIDWMMYVHCELNDALWDRSFQAAAMQANLDALAVTATRLCQLHLGLSGEILWCKGADAELCEALLQSLLSSGNFDRKRGKGNRIESVTANVARNGLFRYLQRAGERNWTVCQRHRWLKPFAWAYQIGRYARLGLRVKRKGTPVLDNLARGRRRSELLKKLKLDSPDI